MANIRGFTLLEVLVASFILFLVIATASLIFSSSVKSQQSATNSIQVNGYLPLMQDHLTARLREMDGEFDTGEMEFMQVQFVWNANVEKKSSVTASAVGESSVSAVERDVKLWSVQLSASIGSLSSQHHFYVLGW